MMKFIIALAATCMAFSAASQKVSALIGEELKLKKGVSDIDILHTDKSGIYLMENHTTGFVFGPLAAVRRTGVLVKLGHDLSEIYVSDFKKELKGKEFKDFMFIKNKAFLIATKKGKSSSQLQLYAVEVDKNSGEQNGDWVMITEIVNPVKNKEPNYILNYSPDSTAMVLTSAVETDKDVTFTTQLFDDKLREINKPLNLNYPVEPKKFEAQHLFYTKQGNLLIVNRLLEYREGKKKKNKFLDFKEYDVRLYGKEGQLIKQVNTTDVNSKYIVRSHVQQMADGNFVLGAFYADKRTKGDIKGILFLRIDQFTGEVINQGEQELSYAQLTTVDEAEDDADDDDETAKERRERKRLEKMQDDDDGISRTYKFREFVPTPDGGFILLAEKNYTYTVMNTSTSSVGTMTSYTTRSTTYEVFGDLLFVKVAKQNTVEWMHMLPKKQQLVINSQSSSSFSGFHLNNYIYNKPATYSSIGTYYQNTTGKLLIFFNDNKKNDKILNAGQKPRTMIKPSKANFYMLSVDTQTGNYKRSLIFSNEEETDPMPATGITLGNSYYMVCKPGAKILSKPKIALGKLTIK